MKNYRRSVMISLMLLTCGGALIGWVSAQDKNAVRQRLVGAWRLETRTVRDASGNVILDAVLGKAPSGRLYYDASGVMMLQMMRQDRKQPISVPANPQDAKNPRIVLGYDAYFGTFEVNEAAGTITHHVEGSLFPEDLGKDFTRKFTLDGDSFTLEFSSPAPQGGTSTRTLLFRRAR